MSKKTKSADKPIPYRLTFKAHVESNRKRVIERLQLFGDFPQCNPRRAISQDWQHILIGATADLFEQLRFDENDPAVQHDILNRLGLVVAVSEAWATALMEE